ncbi:ATP-binding protein [Clostridium sp. WILCCON 0269]|uniref:histidine kinase n=1 Tax=Candidatus Clostridium eludens TaxID=3381663 RepID=A0ABW8SIC7_9CLOT
MSIKMRLKLSYIAMLIIPFVLIIALNNIFISYIEGNTRDTIIGRTVKDKISFYNQVISSNNVFIKKVNKQILQNSDELLDTKYLQQLEKSIGLNHTGIVLRKNKSIIYSSDYIKKDLNTLLLPPFDSDTTTPSNNSWHNKTLIILGEQYFYFKDGSQGSIFYILDVGAFNKFIRKDTIILIICILFILTFTNGLLTYLISRSIIKPLKELENAANEIEQGNLDYKMNVCSKDEIGEVCKSFEKMRSRLRESLEIQQQYEKNRKELISNISHDLKTPITSIKGYIEGIRDGIADTPDKMNKYINTIYTKANYMDNLIDDLFLFSKLDLNRVLFDFQIVDIRNYIKDCVEEINFDLDKDIELTLNIPEDPIMVKVDVQKLNRVIMNIVGNSIKYKTLRKLKINITVKDKNAYTIIEIKDNGRGISEEGLPYIFDRFFRADTSRETTSGGSGLGLAIVKKIIEEHGGQIWAHSSLNEGTTIFFTLKKHTNRGDLA